MQTNPHKLKICVEVLIVSYSPLADGEGTGGGLAKLWF